MKEILLDLVLWIVSTPIIGVAVAYAVTAIVEHFDENPEKMMGAVLGLLAGVAFAIGWTVYFWGWLA